MRKKIILRYRSFGKNNLIKTEFDLYSIFRLINKYCGYANHFYFNFGNIQQIRKRNDFKNQNFLKLGTIYDIQKN